MNRPALLRAFLGLLWSVTSAVVAGLLLAPAAFGHAAFVGAVPQPGLRLEASPERVVLSFTEPLNRAFSKVTLVAANGEVVRGGVQAATEQRIVLKPGTLDAGAYRVRWHTVSTEDGHALEGSFSFGVRAAAGSGEQTLEQNPLARGGGVRVVLRGLLYTVVFLFAAGLLVPLLVRSQPGRWVAPAAVEGSGVDAGQVRAREREIVAATGWLSVVAAIAVTAAEAADAAVGLSLRGLSDFLLANASGIARIVLVGSLLAAVLLHRRHPLAGAAFVAAALAGIAASGHASSADPRAVIVTVDWLHLMAGAVWLGGMSLVVLTWWPLLRTEGSAARQAAARHVLPAFGRVALPAFLLVTVTGGVSLITQLGALSALWETSYGIALFVKINLVGLIAMASAIHAWRLRPQLTGSQRPVKVERQHWRIVRAEPLMGIGVLATVALLVTFPLPPRQLGEADEAVAAQPACDPCPLPKAATDELPVAAQAGSLVVAAWVRRDATTLSAVVRVYDRRGKPARTPIDLPGASASACGVGCARVRLPLADVLEVGVRDRGARFVARLPAVWRQQASADALRLLVRAESAMRGLRSVKEVERVSSGPGSLARTEYSFAAPDRIAFATGEGVRTVIIGDRQWFRTKAVPWQRSSYGEGIAFATRRAFRWTPTAQAVRLLDRRSERGRAVAELAVMDPATPLWRRLVIEERSGRVTRERTVTKAHSAISRYFEFNGPLRIEAPRVG